MRHKWTLCALVLFSSIALAQKQELHLNLNAFELIQPQEESGDELYITVTEFAKNEKPRNYQVPSFPSHWLSKYLNNFKQIVIWKKEIKECKPIDLLITLVEQDAQPIDLDDSLGTVKLKINCNDGKIEQQWVVGKSNEVTKIPNQKNAFTFHKDKAKYNMRFSLEQLNVRQTNKKNEESAKFP